MGYIKGPDFPSAGEIHGTRGIKEAYLDKGSVVMSLRRNRTSSKPPADYCDVAALPGNKAKLIEKIADLVRNKKIEGISDLRDESKVTLELLLRSNAVKIVILNQSTNTLLYKHLLE